MKWYLTVVSSYTSLMASDVEHFFHVVLGSLCVLLGELSVQVLCPFLIELLVFLVWSHVNQSTKCFCKMVVYKVNIQKLKEFLHLKNYITETEVLVLILLVTIYYNNKKNEIIRNKVNQRGKRHVLRKLQNTEERN
ncbi:hypothetical protein HJG60_009767 [Phyllostomus discolor]|uniref:Uncharacterized protein n=1 Tax=Phyllostomus discolor TaxID=89673 RepID=A0A834B2I6_9CHIR|nr:hypothetical protein HJG60_009767 [Phyllostomus discolor]